MTTTELRTTQEAVVRRWARRRRLALEATNLVSAVAYAAVVIGRHEELRGAAIAFPFLVLAIRAAVWRWEDSEAASRRAEVGYALWHHRLVGWARAEEVDAEARRRVHRAWWRRLGLGSVAAGVVALLLFVLWQEVAWPSYALFTGGLALWVLADLVRQERDIRDARRWLADPPRRSDRPS